MEGKKGHTVKIEGLIIIHIYTHERSTGQLADMTVNEGEVEGDGGEAREA